MNEFPDLYNSSQHIMRNRAFHLRNIQEPGTPESTAVVQYLGHYWRHAEKKDKDKDEKRVIVRPMDAIIRAMSKQSSSLDFHVLRCEALFSRIYPTKKLKRNPDGSTKDYAYQLYTFMTANEKERIGLDNHHLYEILVTDRSSLVYFDVELQNEKRPSITFPGTTEWNYDNRVRMFRIWREQCKKLVMKYFPNASCNIFGYHGESTTVRSEKWSIHIILDNYKTRNHADRLKIKYLILSDEEFMKLGFDQTVYSRNQAMKINCAIDLSWLAILL